MAFRFVALLAFVASASAGIISTGPVGYAAPAAYAGYAAPVEYAKQVAYPQQVAYAQPAYHAAPAAVIKTQPILTKAVDEYDPHPQYKFGYDVQDSLSGDSKSQVETRDGDVVQGEYSLIDADGYKRTVQYTADSVHGFNAVVHREPIGVAVKSVAAPAHVAHVATPVAYAAAPTHHVAHIAAPAHVAHVATPVAYAAPAHVAHVSAPVAYAAAPTHHVAHIAAPAQVAYAAGPVVKGAYAVTPVVKAAPVAYPISGHH